MSCLHNGHLYYDNQIFASNTTSIQKSQSNQCVQCICQAGLVLCRLKTCYPNSCSTVGDNSNRLNEDCCPLRSSCRDKPISDSDNDSKNDDYLVSIYSPNDDSTANNNNNKPFGGNDCKSGAKIYENGAKWHPMIGPFGQMDCVICVCMSGTVQCSRISCDHLIKDCHKTKQIQGQCCPICVDPINTESQKSDLNNHRTQQTFSHSMSYNNSKINDNFQQICIPLKLDTIVYRSHAQSSNSAYYQYAFQTNKTNRSTTLYSFTLKDGKITDFSQQYLTYDEYKVLSNTFKFKLLGATKLKFVEKLAKKAKKFPINCQQNCKTRVERLEKSLRIKPIVTNTLCDKNTYNFN
ncbi:chordin-like protein 1 [Oppia nitens]|uniref:chordin-like protein 1 n=1 Tax=Oppia nitens TaxID=1686743 RepID=UPI0023DA5A12|nr:chordin-like protein 1 [Oppia nitens]